MVRLISPRHLISTSNCLCMVTIKAVLGSACSRLHPRTSMYTIDVKPIPASLKNTFRCSRFCQRSTPEQRPCGNTLHLVFQSGPFASLRSLSPVTCSLAGPKGLLLKKLAPFRRVSQIVAPVLRRIASGICALSRGRR